MKQSKLRNERGSVLTLGVGVSILLLMLATTGINVATLWSARSTLNAVADGAALAGAGAINTDAIYKTGVPSALTLNPQFARQRVIHYLSRKEVKSRVKYLKLTKVDVRGSLVTVQLSCRPQLPFGYLLPSSRITVRAVATAQNLSR